jgi:uncharacterized protein
LEVIRVHGPSFLSDFGFFIGILFVNSVVQGFWLKQAWKFVSRRKQKLTRASLQAAWFAAVALIAVGVLDWGLRGRHFLPRDGSGAWAASFIRLWLTTSFLAFVAVEIVQVLRDFSIRRAPAAEAVTETPPINRSRRELFRYATCLAGATPFVAAAYGFTGHRFDYQIRRVEMPVENWPRELDGLRIVQISDIHASEFMPSHEIKRAIDIANGLKADLAVVTGDFITGESDPLAECIGEISRLRAPLGVWGCNGNHEIYAGVQEQAQRLFQQYGMRLLRLENSELSWRGTKFNLIGVDYQREHESGGYLSMLAGIEPLVRRDIPNILLSHNPNSFYRAAELGIELSLAGHTHGGQVKVEILDHSFSPARFMSAFTAGPYRLPFGSFSNNRKLAVPDNNGHTATLYVNCGLGTVGMPVRIGVPPEITLMTLKSTKA